MTSSNNPTDKTFSSEEAVPLFMDMVMELQLANSLLPKIESNTYESGVILAEMSEKNSAPSSSSVEPVAEVLPKIEVNTESTAKSIEVLSGIIDSRMKDLLDALTGNKLQEEENRREFLAMFKGGQKGAPEKKEKMKSASLGGLGMIGGIVALLTGIVASVTGFFAGIASSVAKLMSSTVVGKKILDLLKGTVSPIVEFFQSLAKTISSSKMFQSLREFISKGVSGIKNFFKPITDIFKMLFGSGKGILSSLGRLGKIIATIAPVFSNLGKVLGKAFVPLTILTGIYDTIMGAVKGFQANGIGGALEGGVSGLLSGLIGAPLDLLKSAVSWILGKLGFDEAEKFLDSFDFKSLISGLVDRVFGWGQYLFELLFQPISDAFQNISDKISQGDFFGVILDYVRSVFSLPLDLMKNLVSGIAGIFSKDLKSKIDSFSFAGTFGAATTSETPKAPDFPPLFDESQKKKAEQKVTEQVESLKVEEESLDPFGSFYRGLLEAYQETTGEKITGAEINATQASTADLEAAADSSPIVVANPPAAGPSISSSNQNVTVNSDHKPDRTNLLLQPSFAGY